MGGKSDRPSEENKSGATPNPDWNEWLAYSPKNDRFMTLIDDARRDGAIAAHDAAMLAWKNELLHLLTKIVKYHPTPETPFVIAERTIFDNECSDLEFIYNRYFRFYNEQTREDINAVGLDYTMSYTADGNVINLFTRSAVKPEA
jgi:hypothetical protein